MIYKVLKDFPSRNGVRQYQAGQSIQLDLNSRTKSLLEMGYIENTVVERDSTTTIAEAIYKTGRFEEVKVKPLGRNSFKVCVEE